MRARLVRWGTAAAASIAFGIALDKADPLRGTLLFLPWIVAGLREIDAQIGRAHV